MITKMQCILTKTQQQKQQLYVDQKMKSTSVDYLFAMLNVVWMIFFQRILMI